MFSQKSKVAAIITLVIYLALVVIVAFMPIQQDNMIKIIYNFGLPYDTSGKLLLHSKDGNQEISVMADVDTYRQHEMVYSLENIAAEADNLSIELQCGVQKSQIKAIEFYNHMVQIKRLAPKEILEYFNIGEGERSYFEGPYLIIEAQDESPSLIGNTRLKEEIQSILRQDGRIRINGIILFSVFFITIEFLIFQCDKSKAFFELFFVELKKHIQDIKAIIHLLWEKRMMFATFTLLFVLLCVFIVAGKSKLYHHPDEDVTRMAIDYYLGGWTKPADNGGWIVGTFSDYGFARLAEKTWYYLVAGKVGWIIERFTHLTTYYRMLNVLLFGIMSIMTFLYGRKEKWMYVSLLLSPQLWYLFSYATSDAWDFFWGFIIAFELLHENSILNRYLGGNKLLCFFPICVSGILFAMIFEGKTNYYCILLFAFIHLLFRMFPLKKENLQKLLPKYFMILLATYLAFQFKVGCLDQLANQQNVASVLNESQATTAVVSMNEQHRSLKEVIVDEGAAASLLHSFVGRYGWFGSYDVSEAHMLVMLILYLLFMGILLFSMRKIGRKDIWESLLQIGTCVLMVLAVFIQCWVGDFQSQGRYILPITIILGSVCAKNKKIFSNVLFNGIMLLIVLCNLYSYVFVGMRNLVIPCL